MSLKAIQRLCAIVAGSTLCLSLGFTAAYAGSSTELNVGSSGVITPGVPDIDTETADRAGAFGLGAQLTWIPSVLFSPRGMDNHTYGYAGNGYRYMLTGNFLDGPILLPNGALLVLARLYYYDNDAGVDPGMGLWRFEQNDNLTNLCTLAPASGSPGFTNSATGCNTINETIDNQNNNYVARAIIESSAGTNHRLFGVRLFWQRQLSPAPGTATFGDVSTGHPFFQHIEALFASGITAGCGGGNYCPDDPVTRGQMAVFLAGALGLHFPN